MTSDCSQTLGLIIDLCFHYLFLKNPNISSFELKYLANLKRRRRNQAHFKIIQKNFIRWLHLFYLLWRRKIFYTHVYLFIYKIDYKQIKYSVSKQNSCIYRNIHDNWCHLFAVISKKKKFKLNQKINNRNLKNKLTLSKRNWVKCIMFVKKVFLKNF